MGENPRRGGLLLAASARAKTEPIPAREEVEAALRRVLADPQLVLGALEPLTGPIQGGSPNRLYRIRLRGAEDREYVLRVYRGMRAAERFRVERVVHATLADLGFPVPGWLGGALQEASLGGPFALFERLPGWNGIAAMILLVGCGFVVGALGLRGAGWLALAGCGAVTGRIQARLHRLDAGLLREALGRCGAEARLDLVELRLAELEEAIESLDLAGLAPGLAWLRTHRPREPQPPPVICHGDLHPGNVLVSRRGSLGVVDWEGVGLGPPEYELAATRARLTLQAYLSPALPRPLPWLVDSTLWLLLSIAYLGHTLAVRASRPIDRERLRFCSALEALRLLTYVARARRSTAEDNEAHGWTFDPPPYVERRLLRRFARLTGVTLRLPPAGRPVGP